MSKPKDLDVNSLPCAGQASQTQVFPPQVARDSSDSANTVLCNKASVTHRDPTPSLIRIERARFNIIGLCPGLILNYRSFCYGADREIMV